MDDFAPRLGAYRPDLPHGTVPELEDYCISPQTGFMGELPLEHLPPYFYEWERIATQVGNYLTDKTLREQVDKMPLLDFKRLEGDREKELAFVFLCFMGNGYVWQDGDEGVPDRVPAQLATPWDGLAELLGCKPIICYVAFFLKNWKLRDPQGPICLDNLEQICSWPERKGSHWFGVISLQSEIDAVPGLKAVLECQKSVTRGDIDSAHDCLEIMRLSIEKITSTVKRLKEGLTADAFYNGIRPYMAGWGGEGSALRDGLVYEGVSEDPMMLMGGSNAQMSPYAVFDAALGMTHTGDGGAYLAKALYYMPRAHRDFIKAVKLGPSIRNFVLSHGTDHPLLRKAFNQCVEELVRFRSTHIQIVTSFVIIPSKRSRTSDIYRGVAEKGTGGTALIPFLRGLRNTTKDTLILD